MVILHDFTLIAIQEEIQNQTKTEMDFTCFLAASHSFDLFNSTLPSPLRVDPVIITVYLDKPRSSLSLTQHMKVTLASS